MLTFVRRRATFANVTSLLALFVALGGTAAAANGVIGFGAIRTHHLAVNAVTGVKVKNSSLTINDLTPGARRWLKGRQGATGDAGAAGPAGATGAVGPAGPTGPGVRTTFAEVASTFTTSSTTYVDGGGPTVTVDVEPKSPGASTGFIQVWAQAAIDDNEGGAVALFDVTGTPVAVQGQFETDSICLNTGSQMPVLFQGQGVIGPTVFGTPAALNMGGGCAVTGPAAPVLLEASVGTRRLSMRYLDCDCDPSEDAGFSQRRLWVAPMVMAQ